MTNVFGAVALIILINFGILSGPVYKSFEFNDTYVNNYVKGISNDFQKEVRKNGYIDANTYNTFLDKLNRTKRIYKVEITYTHKLVYPSGTNDFKVLYVAHGTSEIFNTIYKNNQKYYMKYGDDFKIKITETDVESSRKLISSLYMMDTGPDSLLSFSYGGMVENEP